MVLTPHPAFVGTMLSDFPFAFAKNFQADSVDGQVRVFSPGRRFYTDADVLCPPADQRVIGAA